MNEELIEKLRTAATFRQLPGVAHVCAQAADVLGQLSAAHDVLYLDMRAVQHLLREAQKEIERVTQEVELCAVLAAQRAAALQGEIERQASSRIWLQHALEEIAATHDTGAAYIAREALKPLRAN